LQGLPNIFSKYDSEDAHLLLLNLQEQFRMLNKLAVPEGRILISLFLKSTGISSSLNCKQPF